MIKLLLDLCILKIDRSNDWTPHYNGELSGLEKFPYGLVLTPAKLGVITSFCSRKDVEVFPLQVWKQQLGVAALPVDQP